MLQITRQISAYNHSIGNTIQYIVIHSTGNKNDTAKNNADYFGRADRQASAHYFVDDNSIYQVVEESNAAWHCGDGGNKYGIGNHNSIGIEMCGTNNGNISDKTINNTIELVKSLQAKYRLSNDRIVRHYDASRKCCPYQFSSNNWARWNDFKARLVARKNFTIEATANIQSKGIIKYKGVNDLVIGTVGKGLRLEAISINISDIDISYDVHMERVGDVKGSIEGQVEGSIGQAKRLEGITINVKSIPKGYKLLYRTHIENQGWGKWCNSGEYSGTKGKGLRMEAVEIKIE